MITYGRYHSEFYNTKKWYAYANSDSYDEADKSLRVKGCNNHFEAIGRIVWAMHATVDNLRRRDES